MTDDLIDRLVADLKPVSRYEMPSLLAGGALVGLALSAILMLSWLGVRPDIAAAMTGAIFWIKFAFTAAIAVLGAPALLALARPGGRIAWPWLAMVGAAVCVLIAAAVQLSTASPSATRALVLGSTAFGCPFYIVAISAPVLLASLAAMRRMAPTRPALAGLAAGLLSGGTGACIYSFHCDEAGLPFLLAWYGLGMLSVSALGAMLGKLLLRW